MTTKKPTYKYPTASKKLRSLNNAYCFTIKDSKICVCKQLFIATLGINSQIIRTVLKKKEDSVTGVKIRNSFKEEKRFGT